MLFSTAAALKQFAARLAVAAGNEAVVIWLQGELGAGKTTFAQGFLQGAGFAGRVKSPTYPLVEPYETPAGRVYHFDLYRLGNPAELYALGIEDCFEGKRATLLVEWPEKGTGVLPLPDLVCHLLSVPDGRELTLETVSARGKMLLEAGSRGEM